MRAIYIYIYIPSFFVCLILLLFICTLLSKCSQVLGSSESDRKRWEDIIFTFYQKDVVDVSTHLTPFLFCVSGDHTVPVLVCVMMK